MFLEIKYSKLDSNNMMFLRKEEGTTWTFYRL